MPKDKVAPEDKAIINVKLPAEIRNEFRRAIAVHNFATMHTEKGKMTDSQQVFLENLYHGKGGCVSHVKMLVNGKGT